LISDGFQVGNDARVNQSDTPDEMYAYVAFNITGAGSATTLYRSVGTDGSELIDDAADCTVGISGSTATFNSDAACVMPDNIGVGDVLVYNNGSDQLAFIHGRTSAKVFTVKDKDGGTPAATSAGTSVGVYRAYTSLKNWGELPRTENGNITEPSEDDVNPSIDLVTANTIMMVACYGDGEDTSSVTITGWTTGANNYIKIFTPVSSSEVGASQRHDGKWNTSAYRISNDTSNNETIYVREQYVRIDGLQVDSVNYLGTGWLTGIDVNDDTSNDAMEVHISNCIIRMTYSGTPEAGYGITALNNFSGINSDYISKIWNNIIYGYTGSGDYGGSIHAENNGTVYAYNNTCVGGNRGILTLSDPDFIAKNNISIDATDPYYTNASFHADSTNNFSDIDDAPGLNTKTRDGLGSDPIFVNKAGDDYHLDSSDTWAQGVGADLDGDAYLAITDDIDSDARDATTPDIGADEYVAGANSAPTEPTTAYSNNTTAQSGQTDPSGLTDPTPAFSAIYNDPDSGDIANKYRVEVNTNNTFTGTEMWDSGASGTTMTDTTAGNRSPDITYAGTALVSHTTYYWRITFWDDDDTQGTVSATQQFTMGALATVNEKWGENSNSTHTNSTEDTYLDEGQTDFNMGAETLIRVGDDEVGGRINRTMIAFDFSNINITSSSQIVSATLYVRTETDPDPGDVPVDLFAVKKDWYEGNNVYTQADEADDEVTWSHQVYSETLWDTAGCDGAADRETSSIGVQNFTTDETWYSWDVTASAKSMYDNNQYYGWILKAQSEGTVKYWRIYSSEAANASKRPYLEITYNSSATPIYYSVGTDNGDLYSGNASASSGTLTLEGGPAADKIGVGDEIQEGSNRYYITGRNSSTEFTIQDSAATGTPGDTDITFTTTNITIKRAFNLLSSAEVGSSDANHLGNTMDLVTGNFQLNWACYNDDAMNDEVDIDDWITGPSNYIRIFTPTDTNEVGTSQRHTGTAGTGFRIAQTKDLTSDDYHYAIRLRASADYTRIEGIEIDGSGWTNGGRVYGIVVDGSIGASADIRYSHNIVHDIKNSTVHDATAADAFGLECDQGDCRISNNIVYDIENKSARTNAEARGISVNDGNSWIYNNTIYNITNSGGTDYARGIIRNGGTATVRNNAVFDVDNTGNTSEACFSGTMTQSNNVSSDDTGNIINETDYSNYFQNTSDGTENLHLKGDSNSLWGSYGSDLDTDANLPITDDIDGDARDASTPDIGADEYVGSPATALYRSVGFNAGNLNTNSRTVEISGSTATFSGDMPDNVGVGDVLTYNNGSAQIAFIHGRTSATVFTVKDKDGSTPAAAAAGTSVGVYRAYTSLNNWDSQIENTAINEPAEDDVNPSTDLVTANTVMMVACYGDDEDTTPVYINSWTTGPDNYIKIYTPVSSSEVGTSQRHDGAWDTAAYHLSNDGSNHAAIAIRELGVAIPRLRFKSLMTMLMLRWKCRFLIV
jgi:hypothetical protein